MAALLVRRRLDMSAAESVDDLAQVEQIVGFAKRAHDRVVIAVRWRAAGVTCVPVGPLRRNERAAAVGNADEQKQDAAPLDAADNSQRLAFERVAPVGVVRVGERGPGGGALSSPLLANISLPFPLPVGAGRWRRRGATGDMIIVR